MTKKELFKLFEERDLQRRIVGILLSRAVVDLKSPEGDYLFNNIELSVHGETLADNTNITQEYVKEFRDLFPSRKKGDRNLVTSSLRKLFMEVETSKEQVLEAAELYVSEVDDERYVQPAHYFIEKHMPDKEIRQTIREFIERLQEEDNTPSRTRYGHRIV